MEFVDIHADNAQPFEKIRFLQAQIHERNGERAAVSFGRQPYHVSQAVPVEENRFGIRLFVQEQVGSDGKAKAGRREFEEVLPPAHKTSSDQFSRIDLILAVN